MKAVDFFELIGLIWKQFPIYRKHVEKFLDVTVLTRVSLMMDAEFKPLMSPERFELIERCLHRRQDRLIAVVSEMRRQGGLA